MDCRTWRVDHRLESRKLTRILDHQALLVGEVHNAKCLPSEPTQRVNTAEFWLWVRDYGGLINKTLCRAF